MSTIEMYRPLFPMAYLLLSIIAAVIFHMIGVPDTVGGIVIGAAITRVKQPPVTQPLLEPPKAPPLLEQSKT